MWYHQGVSVASVSGPRSAGSIIKIRAASVARELSAEAFASRLLSREGGGDTGFGELAALRTLHSLLGRRHSSLELRVIAFHVVTVRSPFPGFFVRLVLRDEVAARDRQGGVLQQLGKPAKFWIIPVVYRNVKPLVALGVARERSAMETHFIAKKYDG